MWLMFAVLATGFARSVHTLFVVLGTPIQKVIGG
jgi:hypothetical protein